MDLEYAVAFVKKHGDAVGQARLDYLLKRQPPTLLVAQEFLGGQRDDGGWAPFWASDYSSIDATCYRLAQAEQLGFDHTESYVADALQFLVRRQEEDGRFTEKPSVADNAPPWAKPNDLAAELYLTANAGFWLALAPPTQMAAQSAAGFLVRHLEDGKLPSYRHAQWLAGALWWRLGKMELAISIFTALQPRIPEMDASNLAWLLNALMIAGVPQKQMLV